MANYVWNKVICKKSFFDKYFLDPYTTGEENNENCINHKYISFNKLFGVKDLNEYSKKYGAYIYYGTFYTLEELDNNLVEIKFETRWYYPICAIVKAIEIDHDIVWYCIQEQNIYISKFIWKENKVIEKTLDLQTDEFDNWYENYGEDLRDDTDHEAWHYETEDMNWKEEDSNNLIEKYKENY